MYLSVRLGLNIIYRKKVWKVEGIMTLLNLLGLIFLSNRRYEIDRCCWQKMHHYLLFRKTKQHPYYIQAHVGSDQST